MTGHGYTVSPARLPDCGLPGAVVTGEAPQGETVTFAAVSDPVCWVLARMPDGTCAEGTGTSLDAAQASARRSWLLWRRGNPAPLAVDGHNYQRRLKARRRRRR